MNSNFNGYKNDEVLTTNNNFNNNTEKRTHEVLTTEEQNQYTQPINTNMKKRLRYLCICMTN